MTTSRFDQEVGEAYGRCKTCGVELETQTLLEAHVALTFAEAAGDPGQRVSHTVLTTNPSRAGRIETAVDALVHDAIASVVDELERLVAADHITSEEATVAVANWSDFSDGWHNSGE